MIKIKLFGYIGTLEWLWSSVSQRLILAKIPLDTNRVGASGTTWKLSGSEMATPEHDEVTVTSEKNVHFAMDATIIFKLVGSGSSPPVDLG